MTIIYYFLVILSSILYRNVDSFTSNSFVQNLFSNDFSLIYIKLQNYTYSLTAQISYLHSA